MLWSYNNRYFHRDRDRECDRDHDCECDRDHGCGPKDKANKSTFEVFKVWMNLTVSMTMTATVTVITTLTLTLALTLTMDVTETWASKPVTTNYMFQTFIHVDGENKVTSKGSFGEYTTACAIMPLQKHPTMTAICLAI